jgi:hypothetical protein
MRWAAHVACTGLSVVGKPEWKGPKGSRRYEDNIKMDLKNIIWEGVFGVNQDRDKCQAVVKTVMNFRVP